MRCLEAEGAPMAASGRHWEVEAGLRDLRDRIAAGKAPALALDEIGMAAPAQGVPGSPTGGMSRGTSANTSSLLSGLSGFRPVSASTHASASVSLLRLATPKQPDGGSISVSAAAAHAQAMTSIIDEGRRQLEMAQSRRELEQSQQAAQFTERVREKRRKKGLDDSMGRSGRDLG
eukprot:gene47173-29979_t